MRSRRLWSGVLDSPIGKQFITVPTEQVKTGRFGAGLNVNPLSPERSAFSSACIPEETEGAHTSFGRPHQSNRKRGVSSHHVVAHAERKPLRPCVNATIRCGSAIMAHFHTATVDAVQSSQPPAPSIHRVPVFANKGFAQRDGHRRSNYKRSNKNCANEKHSFPNSGHCNRALFTRVRIPRGA